MRIQVTVTGDTATPALKSLPGRFSSRAANLAMANGASVAIKRHLRSKNAIPNKLGGKRTHFYSQARSSTFYEANEAEGLVYIAKEGIRQRYYGGTIRPVNRKALTIPVHASAHGRTAREFGGELRFIAINRGNLVGLLALGNDSKAPILYVLVKKVVQKPDPTVLPTNDELIQAARDGLSNLSLA